MGKSDQFNEGKGSTISLPPSQFIDPGIASFSVFKFRGNFIKEFLYDPLITKKSKGLSSGMKRSLLSQGDDLDLPNFEALLL